MKVRVYLCDVDNKFILYFINMYLLYLLDDVDVVWNIMMSFFLFFLMLFENINIMFEKIYSLKILINMFN